MTSTRERVLGWLCESESWNDAAAASGPSRNLEEGRSSTSQSQSEGQVYSRRRILVVEDSLPDLYLIREAIASAGIAADVDVAQDGHAAIEFVDAADAGDSSSRPDIVLLDLNLPKRNGDEVLRHLRNSRNCAAISVLIITSSDSDRDRKAVSALGAIGYFRKPSDYEEFMKLGAIVKALLGDSRGDSGPAS